MDSMLSPPNFVDLMVLPGFCVKEGKVIHANAAALECMVREGSDVSALLHTGREAYLGFAGGCLYLTLEIGGDLWDATVTRIGQVDIFMMERSGESSDLQALALAAAQLRGPLAGISSIADSLQSLAADAKTEASLSQLNQRLYQLHRLVNNMSDAGIPSQGSLFGSETMNICALVEGLLEKAAVMAEYTGISLQYSVPSQPVFSLCQPQKLERAVWNMLSNALKFTPKSGNIEVCLKQKEKQLYLTVTDSGSGIAQQVQSSLYRRYTRQPGLEDSRYGLGLGMVLIRNAAACHGGTVLIDRPGGTGTRVTMTLAIRQDTTGALRTPVMQVDYAGGLDHGLIELSDVLPPELYAPKQLK